MFEACLALSVLYKLVSTSKNEGAFQESFIINLKTIKNECEATTANLLAVIDDLQQNENTSLVKGLNETVQQQKQILQEPLQHIFDGQRPLYTEYTFDPFDISKMSNITLYTVLRNSCKHHFDPFNMIKLSNN